jgi:aryl-alcohol dehydrogenase-like predicted oxidoreductase
MEFRQFGEGGPFVSVIGLGCNNFGMKIEEKESLKVIGAALEAGITHFDTAEVYGGGRSEEFLGKALAPHRDAVVIASKFRKRPDDEAFHPGALRQRIREGCEVSLQRLQTDRIDVYYQHYPDPIAPWEEVAEALEELVVAGKILHLAASNLGADELQLSSAVGFRGLQIEWNLLSRSVESTIVPMARRLGMGVVPYFPLASGLLTGKYKKGEQFPAESRLALMSNFAGVASTENLDLVDALTRFADDRGHTLLELAVGWLASQDGVVSVITGATTPEQVRANVAAGGWRLSEDDLLAVPAVP